MYNYAIFLHIILIRFAVHPKQTIDRGTDGKTLFSFIIIDMIMCRNTSPKLTVLKVNNAQYIFDDCESGLKLGSLATFYSHGYYVDLQTVTPKAYLPLDN